jgi:hypothetical protein
MKSATIFLRRPSSMVDWVWVVDAMEVAQDSLNAFMAFSSALAVFALATILTSLADDHLLLLLGSGTGAALLGAGAGAALVLLGAGAGGLLLLLARRGERLRILVSCTASARAATSWLL